MKTIKKVSFDFDSTLSRLDIQQYAKELLNRGIDVWICTSRFDDNNARNKYSNDDLYLVADELGIQRENIIFTNMQLKYYFLNGNDFIFHIDDDNIELEFLESESDVTPIRLFGNGLYWKRDCELALENSKY
jgi:hypothetical protein